MTLNLPSINHSDQLQEVQHNYETFLMGYNTVVSHYLQVKKLVRSNRNR